MALGSKRKQQRKGATKAPSSDSDSDDYQPSGVHLTGDEGPPSHWT